MGGRPFGTAPAPLLHRQEPVRHRAGVRGASARLFSRDEAGRTGDGQVEQRGVDDLIACHFRLGVDPGFGPTPVTALITVVGPILEFVGDVFGILVFEADMSAALARATRSVRAPVPCHEAGGYARTVSGTGTGGTGSLPATSRPIPSSRSTARKSLSWGSRLYRRARAGNQPNLGGCVVAGIPRSGAERSHDERQWRNRHPEVATRGTGSDDA